jgi:hypothetical protein
MCVNQCAMQAALDSTHTPVTLHLAALPDKVSFHACMPSHTDLLAERLGLPRLIWSMALMHAKAFWWSITMRPLHVAFCKCSLWV